MDLEWGAADGKYPQDENNDDYDDEEEENGKGREKPYFWFGKV